eukprot:9138016-Pyramimonas_sp.AAC.1
MEKNADRRIPPLLADGSTPDAATVTSRSGRVVRRPGTLAQYLLCALRTSGVRQIGVGLMGVRLMIGVEEEYPAPEGGWARCEHH